MLLKPSIRSGGASGYQTFSTLYRVDAIEAEMSERTKAALELFQYPLSGRCY